MSKETKPTNNQDDVAYSKVVDANSVDIFDQSEPLSLFENWLKDATKKEPNDASAMSLATVDAAGMPDVRMVLLKGADESGFVFYTNLESAKGEQLVANAKAALCFHWKSIRRQVRIRGLVQPVSSDEADAYFDSRPRDSRIGAWASQQSRPLESRFALEKAVAREAAKFGLGGIERPPHWSGFRVLPLELEFWRDRPFRLHDRMKFSRDEINSPWVVSRLYP
jgi:pyridoxamine 5'-phosphate oxidase